MYSRCSIALQHSDALAVTRLTGRGAIVEGEEEDFMTRMRGRALDTDLIQEAACSKDGTLLLHMSKTNTATQTIP